MHVVSTVLMNVVRVSMRLQHNIRQPNKSADNSAQGSSNLQEIYDTSESCSCRT